MNGIVINANKFKVAFCSLNVDKSPRFYELQEGEKVIETDWNIANSMNKPKWDGEKWIDTETLPIVESPIKEPNKIDILQDKVQSLQDTIIMITMM